MRRWWEQAICIADVDIAIEVDSEALLEELCEPLASYASRGVTPLVRLRYALRSATPRGLGSSAMEPGFSCRSSSSDRYVFERQDACGEVELAQGAETIRARFDGARARFSLEAALRVTLSLALPRLGALFLHSSGVFLEGRSVLFAGPSGAGKSTIASLLKASTAFQGLLGDDLNIARPEQSGSTVWMAHSTPFAGALACAPRTRAQLDGIHFLEQSTRNRAVRLERARALPRVLRNMLAYVQEREAADRALETASAIVRDVPCYALEFAPDTGVAAEVLSKMRRPTDERRRIEA
jgi:hypothetical protein